MNRIISRGFGPGSMVVSRGYGSGPLITRLREILRLCSCVSKQLLLTSEWRNSR